MSQLPGPIKRMPKSVELELVTMRCHEQEAEIARLRAEKERLMELACNRHISEALESGQLLKMKAELQTALAGHHVIEVGLQDEVRIVREECERARECIGEWVEAVAEKNAALDRLEFLELGAGEVCPACGWPKYGMNGKHAPDCWWQKARCAGKAGVKVNTEDQGTEPFKAPFP